MPGDPRAITEMFADVSLGSPDNAVGFVLWRLTHRFQREIDRQLADLNLTHLQFTTLALVAWIGRETGVAEQAEIARQGGVHPMQISLMLKALEKKALVRRTRSAGRPKAKSVEMTDSGLDALRKAMPIAIEIQRKMFGEDGQPGGALLQALLQIERDAAEGE